MAKENDVVSLYFEDKPLIFARIEKILPDAKPDWYHVKLLILQTPLYSVTWILRDTYIEGEEFTMSGKKVRMEIVVCPEKSAKHTFQKKKQETSKKPGGAKIISLAELRARSKIT
ncbi:MAG: hypothetical protein JRE64_03595 [Deltaproteobacteria bacterium]|nr:hypothetical protein [Deltaproteobacteria bacterium]